MNRRGAGAGNALAQSRKPVVLDFTRHTLWISPNDWSRDLDLLKLDTDRQTHVTEERGFVQERGSSLQCTVKLFSF